MKTKDKKFILWFREINNKDVGLVGGKNASLGEMYQELSPIGIRIPNGFAITAYAYFYFIKKNKLEGKIRNILKGLDAHNVNDLFKRGKMVREMILQAPFPKELEKEIIKGYCQLESYYKKNGVDVAVRSSATAEDLPDASFAGQQETYLNIRSRKHLLIAVKKCFASLFTNRAISYREDKRFNHFKIGLSVGVQKMVRADKAASGVMFSIDTESGFQNAVVINSAYGLGENIVQGEVIPDEFFVFKPTLKQSKSSILLRKLGTKRKKMVYSTGRKPTKNVKTTKKERQSFSINDADVLQLAKWACAIEDHYTKKAKRFKPMDMEWAKDGVTGELFIVQARPETVHSQKDYSILEEYQITGEKGKLLTAGTSVGSKIGHGKARVILDVKDIGSFQAGEVLVTDMTDPDWEPIMKIASAIVTDRGGRTAHAAIVSRELGVPCVVGTNNATRKIKTGQNVTVSCAEGESGYVYEGLVPFKIKKTNLKKLKRPKTEVKMIIGEPELAFSYSFIPNDGVGLARLEFIINSYIKIHPLALLNFSKLKNQATKRKIEKLTQGYKNKAEFYTDKLAEGIAMIGAAFWPKEVIFRLSDFKSDEYMNLIGGDEFEPVESNPMLGWRGASRYYDKKFVKAFELECKAFKRAREVVGLKNIKIMVPVCRTLEEGKKVLALMERFGLKQHQDGLEVYVMCEVPSNVILADKFANIFDGFSIGSNDLTQFTMAIDRNSEIVKNVADERNEAVKTFIVQAIRAAHREKKPIGICGQAPSDFPDFAEFLVGEGIDSISLNPDTMISTTLRILKAEARRKR